LYLVGNGFLCLISYFSTVRPEKNTLKEVVVVKIVPAVVAAAAVEHQQ